MLSRQTLQTVEEKLKTKRIGLLGDFCVDIYWHADMRLSELSRETPQFPLPVTSERVALGAGGNVAANIAALRPAAVLPLSVYGDDWRGSLMLKCAENDHVDTSFLISLPERITNAYCKPMRHGISDVVYEDPRLDFEARKPLSAAEEAQVLQELQSLSARIDILCVADQFDFGVVTPNVRKAVMDLARSGLPVIIDSRRRIGEFTDCILKPNEMECWRAISGETAAQPESFSEVCAAAERLALRNRATVFCTLGEAGAFLTNGTESESVPAVPISGPVDVCGAGDTTLSAFACAVACGVPLGAAAEFAAAASAVTVQKCGETGTASLAEIEALISG